ncbi:hypothetical protein [Paenibacillus lautus]|uniref:hypothetical protein n=1 Tax=Paenibacillus lautus TaxID=1401 RepID=UPI002DBA58D3|nr:hypothetical protein [Paenibacillus lautus]MEC0259350.1 hypothetical protein [Paenibacillus lautus]
MQTETMLMLTLIAATLQVVIQFLGVAKAFMEWLAAKEKAKGSNRSHRSKPKRNKPK